MTRRQDALRGEEVAMRITFIEPNLPSIHVFSKIRLPRLGPVLPATMLRRKGHDASVELEDSHPLNWHRLEDNALVGISTITSTAPRAYAIADRLRDAGVPVVIGGPHATFLPDEALQHAEWVVRGEADAVIEPFLGAFSAGRGFGEIPGLSWREGVQVVHNALGPAIEDLDTLPAWECRSSRTAARWSTGMRQDAPCRSRRRGDARTTARSAR